MKSKSLFTILILIVILSISVPVVTTAQGGERVPTIVVLSETQGTDPIEFEMTRLVVENMRQLGLDVEHRAIPWEQQSDIVWYNRQDWQMTAWRMVGRPERMDPDEFVVNLFHTDTAESGYNFVGYLNPEYDALAEAQRGETDREKRRDLIFQAQELIARDVPYVYVAHPTLPQLVRTDIWDEASIVDQQGIGVQNFWTWIGLTPLGDQKAIVTNSPSVINAVNPFYISGDIDSRVTELVWDRLMRLGPDGLPQPWAAESVVWEDNVNVVVKLRAGMTWHDGQPVTSEDVKFSFEAPSGGEVPMYSQFVVVISNIEIIDDLTVRFTLSEPRVAFETASLAKLNLVPKHIWEPILADLAGTDDNAESYQEEVPIGSGPYKFVAWEPEETLILEANAEHFSPPKAEQWILRIIPNAESTLGQIQTGEINFLREWPGDSQVLQEVADNDPNIALFSVRNWSLLHVQPAVEPLTLGARRAAHKCCAMPSSPTSSRALVGRLYVSVAIDYQPESPAMVRYRSRAALWPMVIHWDEGRLLHPAE
jgi:peptide/nickel transport system substrate-binding protein